jgi:serine/threonine protein kinase
MQPLAQGAVLKDGRFVIVRLIAHGGQATTYEGIDKREGQRVAIKRFVVRGASSWKDVELAEREARVLSSLSHPGIPRHVAHFEEQGELFLVTEYIDGDTLDALSKRRASPGGMHSHAGPSPVSLSQADVVSYLFAIASLLDYLHAQSPPIIHRDIKPKNVIRRSDGSFVLVDFGSVRDHLKPEGGSTVVGTFGYMAPEQFQGRALPATDTYAAAATALALLTGRDPDQLPHQGLKLDVEKALGASVSSEFKRVLNSALEPDPDRRAQRLSQLLANSTLSRSDDHRSRSNERRDASPARSGATTTAESGGHAQAVPFRTHGYQRSRSANEQRHAQEQLERRLTREHEQRAHEHEHKAHEQVRAHEHKAREQRRASKKAARAQRREARHVWRADPTADPIVDIETPLRIALRDADIRRWLHIPLVALVFTIVLVLLRTALWFVLGVLLPIVLTLIHRLFGAPVLEQARRSRHVARQLRSQMRNVSLSLGEGSEQDVRFRVSSTSPAPDVSPQNSKASFARQFDEEAFELETELEESVEKLGRK